MVDVATAQHHGVCPTCEGYGGTAGKDCPNEECMGSCSWCWCPGCHDGNVEYPLPDSEERCGSWEAYAALHPDPVEPAVHPDQMEIEGS
jgi:hypothetical protein